MKSRDAILLIADVRGWAFDNIAQYVQSLLSNKYNCYIIYTNDYKTYEAFLNGLNQYKNIKLIHFFYRGYLLELIDIAAINSNRNITKILLNTTITTSIPDHLFVENEDAILRNLSTFQFIDNYYVTSKKLYDIYINISEYPKPWQVIYDNVLIDNTKHAITKQESSAKLCLTWIGNSSWGNWYNNTPDYKGIKTVIIPAFEQLNNEGVQFKKYIVDKNERVRSRQEIWEILKETDILLVASVQEGTPLTLIEAMAFGCAIITTDVGIAREVLPDIQHEFIINRSSLELVDAIKKLNINRKLLTNIKQQNVSAYQKIFANKVKQQNLWYSFIKNSIDNHIKNKALQKKQQVLKNINPQNKDYFFIKTLYTRLYFTPSFRKAAQILLQYPIVNRAIKRIIILLNSSPLKHDGSSKQNMIQKFSNTNNVFYKILYRIYSFPTIKKTTKTLLRYSWIRRLLISIASLLYSLIPNSSYYEYERFKKNIIKYKKQNQQDAFYVIYSDIFPGVANSTQTLFDQVIPLNGSIGYLPDTVITEIAQLIIKTDIKNLIISGGLDVHAQLVNILYKIKKNKDLNIYFLWHGSPAQWVDVHHAQNFYKWINLYKQHKIKAIITLKKDLEQFLIANNIQSYLLQNFIPTFRNKTELLTGSVKGKKFRIGIWGAYDIWIKNLYPQFAAVSMLKDQVCCYTNFHFSDNKYANWIVKDIEMQYFPTKLSYNKLMQLMVHTDLTLYITNSECSPMIALESLGLGVPCLVGPTADVYDDKFLRNILTVNRVDCPVAIFDAIKKVQQNIDIIRSRLPDFVEKYNKKALDAKNSLLTAIRKQN